MPYEYSEAQLRYFRKKHAKEHEEEKSCDCPGCEECIGFVRNCDCTDGLSVIQSARSNPNRHGSLYGPATTSTESER